MIARNIIVTVGSILNTAKAERLLGWEATYTWRKVLGMEETAGGDGR